MSEAEFNNARHFDTILTEWNDISKSLLEKLIDYKIDYFIKYWKF